MVRQNLSRLRRLRQHDAPRGPMCSPWGRPNGEYDLPRPRLVGKPSPLPSWPERSTPRARGRLPRGCKPCWPLVAISGALAPQTTLAAPVTAALSPDFATEQRPPLAALRIGRVVCPVAKNKRDAPNITGRSAFSPRSDGPATRNRAAVPASTVPELRSAAASRRLIACVHTPSAERLLSTARQRLKGFDAANASAA
jgi:hypothetical protein